MNSRCTGIPQHLSLQVMLVASNINCDDAHAINPSEASNRLCLCCDNVCKVEAAPCLTDHCGMMHTANGLCLG